MLEKLQTRQDELNARHQMLVPLFIRAAEGRIDDPALVSFVAAQTDPSQSIVDAMQGLQTWYVANIFNDIATVNEAALAELRHVRLLLRSPRPIFHVRDGGAVTFDDIADMLSYKILSLMDLGIPELMGTAVNYLVSARSYPDVAAHHPDAQADQIRAVAEEYEYIMNGIAQSPMNDAEMASFYASYDDMSDDPCRDYMDNTLDLVRLHQRLGELTMDRIELRILGIYLAYKAEAEGTPAGMSEPYFIEKVTETANMFIRLDRALNQSTEQVRPGVPRRRDGAQDFLQQAQAEYAHYPQDYPQCGPA